LFLSTLSSLSPQSPLVALVSNSMQGSP
jgi:hypothetical protein